MRRLPTVAMALMVWLVASFPAVATAQSADIESLAQSPEFSASDADTLRLYWAFFNRDPDLDGANYWISVRRGGASLDEIAGLFAASEEFTNAYGAPDNTDYLRILYQNVLGRQPDEDGFNYWRTLLDNSQLTRGGVVRWIAANDEFLSQRPYPASPRPGAGRDVQPQDLLSLRIPFRRSPAPCDTPDVGADSAASLNSNIVREVGPPLIADLDGDGIMDGVAVFECEIPDRLGTGRAPGPDDYRTGIVVLRGSDRSAVFSSVRAEDLDPTEQERRGFFTYGFDPAVRPSITSGNLTAYTRSARYSIDAPGDYQASELFSSIGARMNNPVTLKLGPEQVEVAPVWGDISSPVAATSLLVAGIVTGDLQRLSSVLAFGDGGAEDPAQLVSRYPGVGSVGSCVRPNPEGPDAVCQILGVDPSAQLAAALVEVGPERWMVSRLIFTPPSTG